MVAPSVVYNGDGCVGLRRFLLSGASIERFYGFENRAKVFPIDSRYKFVSLVFLKGESQSGTFEAAFMRHDLQELETSAHFGECGNDIVTRPCPPWMVFLPRREIEQLSPESFAFLEFRSPRDQNIVRLMHKGSPTLGGNCPGSWGSRLISWRAHEVIFNATEDKDLWTNQTSGRYHCPEAVLHRVPIDFNETLMLMREKGFWPVFEGKHIEQLLVGMKPIRWWLSVEQMERKYGRQPLSGPLLVFREAASGTNERTCIAAVLPRCSVATNKPYGVLMERVEINIACSVLNSFAFDYALRFRVSTNVHPTHIRPVAVPNCTSVSHISPTNTTLTWGSHIKHITEDSGLWPHLWAVNRSVAEAYGIGPDDFEHILCSFPGFARKRPAFHAYLRARLAEWLEEAGDVRGVISYEAHEAVTRLPRVAEKGAESDGEEPA
jgi:hypothetical protein